MRVLCVLACIGVVAGCLSAGVRIEHPQVGPKTILDSAGDTPRAAADLLGVRWDLDAENLTFVAYLNGVPDVEADLDYAGGLAYRPVGCPECYTNWSYHWSFGLYKITPQDESQWRPMIQAKVWSPEAGNESTLLIPPGSGSGVHGSTIVFRFPRPDVSPPHRLEVSNVDFGTRHTTDDPDLTVPCYYDHITTIPNWSQPIC